MQINNSSSIAIFIVSTWEDGLPPGAASWFFKSLAEAGFDFRVDKNYLKKLSFAVFGLGNSLYGEDYNKVSYSLLMKKNKVDILFFKFSGCQRFEQ